MPGSPPPRLGLFAANARFAALLGSAFAALCVRPPAQSIADDLEAIRLRIVAGAWKEAYDGLRELAARPYGNADAEKLRNGFLAVSHGFRAAGDLESALAAHEGLLAVLERPGADPDPVQVAQVLNDLGVMAARLGRHLDAQRAFERSLKLLRRAYVGTDDPLLVRGIQNFARNTLDLGQPAAALPLAEEALAMSRRLATAPGAAPRAALAQCLQLVARCLEGLGRGQEALAWLEEAVALIEREHAGNDHREVASMRDALGSCLLALGQSAEALPLLESALAMRRALLGSRPHPDLTASLNNVGVCLKALGRLTEALPHIEAAVAMNRRRPGGDRLPSLATSLHSLGSLLLELDRPREALAAFEEALAIRMQAYAGKDHPQIAGALNNIAACLESMGDSATALDQFERSLAMCRRLFGDRDHPDIALREGNIAYCLLRLGRAEEALPRFESALAMWRRCHGARDAAEVVQTMHGHAYCLQVAGQPEAALAKFEQAAGMIERLREHSRIGSAGQQVYFDHLKRFGTFEALQVLHASAGRVGAAFEACERARSRGLLDLLEQQRFDAFEEAERRARLRGDEIGLDRLRTLRADLASAELQSQRALHALTSLDDDVLGADLAERRRLCIAESDAAHARLRLLLDERARLLGDVLPVGRVRTLVEIQAALEPGEVLLQFTLGKRQSLLFVVAADAASVVPLPDAMPALQRALPELLASAGSSAGPRGRDPAPGAAAGADELGPELFERLIPPAQWRHIRTARRVFVAAHRELHRIPLELLVTEVRDGLPVRWIDSGPPIAYVPSGSALHWMRRRARDAHDDATRFDLVAVGDPGRLDDAPEVPEQGAYVFAVDPDGQGAAAGIRPGDVLVRYDGVDLADDRALREASRATAAAIEDGQRPASPVPVELWRCGASELLEVRPGALGLQVAAGAARAAHAAAVAGAAQPPLVQRSGDLERLRRLPPLRGARAETQAIEALFAAIGGRVATLIGSAAAESAVFDLAPQAKCLHFACHGIAEEYTGQSLSMLVLSQPTHVLPGDDGLLQLSDLLHRWRGRLGSCRLVVLSACQTNVGPTLRDEAQQALPIGFLFAGASAVVSSAWAVHDDSTSELMRDFYARLLAGETDCLAALTAAKKALRAKHPQPFHWAPFQFLGAPE